MTHDEIQAWKQEGRQPRPLTKADGIGFTVCHAVVQAGTVSKLQYRNHLEACYWIAGEGDVEDMQCNLYPIRPGDIYVLDQHDEHYLRGGANEDLVLVSVFNPPLAGHEHHNLDGENRSSSY